MSDVAGPGFGHLRNEIPAREAQRSGPQGEQERGSSHVPAGFQLTPIPVIFLAPPSRGLHFLDRRDEVCQRAWLEVAPGAPMGSTKPLRKTTSGTLTYNSRVGRQRRRWGGQGPGKVEKQPKHWDPDPGRCWQFSFLSRRDLLVGVQFCCEFC